MTTTERLLKASESVWAEYHDHPFVLGMQNGTLEEEKFRYYIMQDYLYLIEYAKVFAVGIAKSSRLDVMQLFTFYIQAIINGEMDIHNGYMGKLHIQQSELDAMPIALDNRSYTAYMISVAYAGGEAETMAAILSCALSYEAIAKHMVEGNSACVEDPLYGDWVRGYISDRYHHNNEVLVEMIERLTADYNEAQLQNLEDIFVTCSRYEKCFWDMAWEMRK